MVWISRNCYKLLNTSAFLEPQLHIYFLKKPDFCFFHRSTFCPTSFHGLFWSVFQGQIPYVCPQCPWMPMNHHWEVLSTWACAQHFSRGWLRNMGTGKNCKRREALKERKWAEVPLHPTSLQVLVGATGSLCALGGCVPEKPPALLKTRLPSGLALKGREIKQAERCLPAVTSAGWSIPCTAPLHSIAPTAASGLPAEHLSAKYFRRCWRYFKLEVYLPTSNWPESKGEADCIL